jgi:hypothetical protein
MGLEDETIAQKIKVLRIDIEKQKIKRQERQEKTVEEFGEYDDELTFTKTGPNSISLVLDNKGNTFIIPDYAGYYSLAGGINTLNTTGTKALAFTDATSNSTTANSTRIKFTVPGHGLLSWGVGTSTYEILEITSTTLSVRSIGADGNAWYQKFKVK